MTALHQSPLTAVQAVAALEAAARRHRAVRHPYLAALADVHLPDPAWALALANLVEKSGHYDNGELATWSAMGSRPSGLSGCPIRSCSAASAWPSRATITARRSWRWSSNLRRPIL